jgi:hypothetical protein
MGSCQRVLFLSLAIVISVSGPLQAQNCRTDADTSAWIRDKVGTYALATDSLGKAVRDSLKIDPATSLSAITLITKQATCSSANTAYRAAIVGGLRQTFSGKVYVIQTGKSYMVWDPAFRYGTAPDGTSSAVFVVFDSRWVKRSIFN